MQAKFGPGQYYLGDICYVLKDDIYKDIWGKQYKYEEGCFEASVQKKHLTVCQEELTVLEKESFAVASTAWGDGEYQDGQGRKYGVDAGVIGIVPFSMWKVDAIGIAERELGTVLTIKKELTMNAENGIFTVTADDEEIVIDTKNQPELDDKDWDKDWDEGWDEDWDEGWDEDWDDEDGDEDFEEDEDLDEDDGNGFEKE